LKYKFRYTGSGIDYLLEEKLGTLLTLSNGRFSLRGELELAPSKYGLFVSHIYDYTPIFYRELVNLPRPVAIYIMVDDTPLSLVKEGKYSIERTLDIDSGTLETIVKWNNDEKQLVYKSLRIVHKKIKELAAIKASIEVKGFSGKLIIVSPIEFNTINPLMPEDVSIRHYKVIKSEANSDGIGIEVETLDKKYRVGIASSIRPNDKKYRRKILISQDSMGEELIFNIGNEGIIEIMKYIGVSRNIEVNDPLERSFEVISKAYDMKWNDLVQKHVDEWKKIWSRIDLRIEGDEYIERLLKFNAFHLLQLVDDDSDYLIIPSRGLHGIGYRGHVFWDTDTYTLPFYIAFDPRAARRILMYRCKFIEEAKKYARSLGYNGARYPWESADDGVEATPREIPLDPLGKDIVRIYTGDEEEHITADIAYAVDLYYNATMDQEFMSKCGLKILFETARYWTSRVVFENGKYVIKHTMGPDEYHHGVNNSFYINTMVRRNLDLAIKYYHESLRIRDWRRIIEVLKVSEEEVKLWRNIRNNIHIPCRDDGLCEEFDGYMLLEDFKVKPNCIGEKCLPPEIIDKIEKTRLVKQADVVAAMFLLKNEFSEDIIMKNFKYYLERTTHSSSLSIPMYSALAARLGLMDLAYNYLLLAAASDLEDIYDNTEYGFHIGAAGGTWLAFLHGFIGINYKDGEIIIDKPRILSKWRRILFNISSKNGVKRIIIENTGNDVICSIKEPLKQ